MQVWGKCVKNIYACIQDIFFRKYNTRRMFLCGLWFGVMSMPLQRKASLKIKNIKTIINLLLLSPNLKVVKDTDFVVYRSQ